MRESLGPYFDTLFKATREAECSAAGGAKPITHRRPPWREVCEIFHECFMRAPTRSFSSEMAAVWE